MRVPQVTDRMKEAPAHALRAVFAGIGQVLLVADRIRNRPANGNGAPATQTAPTPAAAAAPSTSSPPAPAATAVTAVAAARTAVAAPAAGDLPVPNYDELSVASLRARMRNLDPAQLRALAAYERSHAARAVVLAMFERRIAKVESGEA
jgi:hypothetical protein